MVAVKRQKSAGTGEPRRGSGESAADGARPGVPSREEIAAYHLVDEMRLAGGLIAAGVGSGVTATGRLAVRSEEERIADLWRTERELVPSRNRSGLKLRPQLGLGGFGLSGTF